MNKLGGSHGNQARNQQFRSSHDYQSQMKQKFGSKMKEQSSEDDDEINRDEGEDGTDVAQNMNGSTEMDWGMLRS